MRFQEEIDKKNQRLQQLKEKVRLEREEAAE
jgi:hypothetical protein